MEGSWRHGWKQESLRCKFWSHPGIEPESGSGGSPEPGISSTHACPTPQGGSVHPTPLQLALPSLQPSVKSFACPYGPTTFPIRGSSLLPTSGWVLKALQILP